MATAQNEEWSSVRIRKETHARLKFFSIHHVEDGRLSEVADELINEGLDRYSAPTYDQIRSLTK